MLAAPGSWVGKAWHRRAHRKDKEGVPESGVWASPGCRVQESAWRRCDLKDQASGLSDAAGSSPSSWAWAPGPLPPAPRLDPNLSPTLLSVTP